VVVGQLQELLRIKPPALGNHLRRSSVRRPTAWAKCGGAVAKIKYALFRY
jgi:hypothetical protein